MKKEEKQKLEQKYHEQRTKWDPLIKYYSKAVIELREILQDAERKLEYFKKKADDLKK